MLSVLIVYMHYCITPFLVAALLGDPPLGDIKSIANPIRQRMLSIYSHTVVRTLLFISLQIFCLVHLKRSIYNQVLRDIYRRNFKINRLTTAKKIIKSLFKLIILS